MTTYKKLLKSTPENYSQQDSQLESSASISFQPQKTSQIWWQNKALFASKLKNTLRGRLLLTVLPIVLVPLAITSLIGINFTQTQAKQKTLENLEKSILLTSESTQSFLERAFSATDLLAANPLVIQALSSGKQMAESQGLLKQPIEKIEKDFTQTKLLQPNASLNQYLKAVADNKGVAEIILTESNGFNVAYSSPTSDFVQSDESWWQTGEQEGKKLLEPEFDESTNTAVLELVNSIRDANSNQLLGITKIGVSVQELNQQILATTGVEITQTEQIQIVDAKSGKALDTLNAEGAKELGDVIGGQVIIDAINIFNQALNNATDNIAQIIPDLEAQTGISQVKFKPTKIDAQQIILSFEYQNRLFEILRIPNTDLMVVASVDRQEIAAAGRNLTIILSLTAIILGAIAIVVIIQLAKQLAQPLTNLTTQAQKVAQGDLSAQATPEGTFETVTLADNFNQLVKQVKNLINEQEAIAKDQKQQKENLEQEIFKLLDEVEGALEGDLTVRASLTSIEMSTVSDLFNAIIDNLQDIAVQVKQSSSQVSSSLNDNQKSIKFLAEQAVEEVTETNKTLQSVAAMSQSIQEVSQNANQASTLANETYNEIQQGTNAIDETANSIVELRTTVAETAKKMKNLEKSSQKITQIVSLIEEITLKTNLLAINAAREGNQGQGFNVFGEQLATLGEQSAAATKEIEQIVAEIRLETQEVSDAMDLGNSQAAQSTRLVKSTKQRLEEVLERSQNINELMQSISQTTVSQSDTSQLITKLMEQIAQHSEERLNSSQQVSESMVATAHIAQELKSAVEQFKVNEQ